MAQYIETRTKTFVAGGALGKWRRVRLSAGVLAYAGASDTDALGVTTKEVFASDVTSGDPNVAVDMVPSVGTVPMVASGAVTQFAQVYAAASGKVSASGSVLVGVALQAASGNNSIIEVLPLGAVVIGQVADQPYSFPLNELRIHDDFDSFLPESATSDDLGFAEGTFGSSAPTIVSNDFGGTTTTQYARFLFPLPAEYVDGESITLRVRAGMSTTVSDTTATIDAEVYAHDGDGSVSSDICATAAQDCNSLTLANLDFTITPTSRVAGEVLDIRLTFAGNDSGNAGVMTGLITNVQLLLDVNG